MRTSVSMKARFSAIVPILLLLFATAPDGVYAQSPQSQYPPLAAQLVREGDLAVALGSAFGVGGGNEIEAENRLSDLAIIPKNGWMADYPVTPDIVAELQQAIVAAADASRLPFGRDEAQKRLDAVLENAGLLERPYDSYAGGSQGAPQYYPDQGELAAYYEGQGPPVVTYYMPPPEYCPLYWWIDYPFYYSGFWLPGFFILRDFHRPYHDSFVSNHYAQAGSNTVFRVNPAARLAGQANIGVSAPPARALRLTSPAGRTSALAPPMAPAGSSASRMSQRVNAGSAFSPFRAPPSGPPRLAMAAPGMRTASSFGGPSPSRSFHASASLGRGSSSRTSHSGWRGR